jgi:hypothetical protein
VNHHPLRAKGVTSPDRALDSGVEDAFSSLEMAARQAKLAVGDRDARHLLSSQDHDPGRYGVARFLPSGYDSAGPRPKRQKT